MRVWVCTDHPGHWPVGVASVVLAQSEDQAKSLLEQELALRGLSGEFTLRELDATVPAAHVLNDGEY
jgi:hypothetical protein